MSCPGARRVKPAPRIASSLVFMGVHGMDARSGFTTPNMLEAEANRALIESGRRLVVVADHTKWGVIGISSIARLDQADTLITDNRLDPEAAAELARSVRELILVDVGGPAASRSDGVADGSDGAERAMSAPPAR